MDELTEAQTFILTHENWKLERSKLWRAVFTALKRGNSERSATRADVAVSLWEKRFPEPPDFTATLEGSNYGLIK